MIRKLWKWVQNKIDNRRGIKTSSFNMITEYQADREDVLEREPERGYLTPPKERFVPVDISLDLPLNPDRNWNERSTNLITIVPFHQQQGGGTINGVARWHIKPGPQNNVTRKGAPGIVYHIVIDYAGKVFITAKFYWQTWHTRGANTIGLGVMVQGNFAGKGYGSGTDKLSAGQKKSIPQLMRWLVNQEVLLPNFKGGDSFKFHSDYGKSYCPGFEIEMLIKQHRILIKRGV